MLLKMSSTLYLIGPLIYKYTGIIYTGIRQQHTAKFGPDQLEGSIRLFLERNADQMPLVAHYIYPCFHARVKAKKALTLSHESHLAPQQTRTVNSIESINLIDIGATTPQRQAQCKCWYLGSLYVSSVCVSSTPNCVSDCSKQHFLVA